MTNPNERNSEQQQPKPVNTADQSKNPTHDGGQYQPKQQDPSKQDPSKKDPSQADDSRQRDRETSEQAEKRRA
jgi:hypothetical protein